MFSNKQIMLRVMLIAPPIFCLSILGVVLSSVPFLFTMLIGFVGLRPKFLEKFVEVTLGGSFFVLIWSGTALWFLSRGKPDEIPLPSIV